MSSTLSYNEEVVPIEKLREDEELRSLVPPNNMKEQLVSSITKNGQTLPIDVDSSYIILDGYTRFQIFRELKFKEVKVRKWNFKSSEDRVTAYKLMAMLNLQRRHLEKNEVLKLLRELAEKIEKISKEVQKVSANADNLEHNNETNIKPDKTEIKLEERQKVSANADTLEHNNETNIKPRELELKMKQVKEEIGAKDVKDVDIQEYSLISTIPYLRQLVDEGKISVRTAYELYKKAKDKLQKIANLPKYERDQLLATKEGRKILLERDDLLQLILDHKMAVSQAINKVKMERKASKSKKKSNAEESEELEKEKEGEELESEVEQKEDNEEYPFVEEWQKAAEKEAEQQLTPQLKTEGVEGQQISRLESKPDQGQLESQKEMDLITELKTKGFAELPFEVALIKIEGKCYAINVEALHDLEQGLPEKWKDLETFLNKYGIIIPGEAEGLYVIPWKLLGRCNEWK
ncbi:MAG: ParB N-terminal domain-containing protein [Acidianus sp.]|uniref:ParB N-terminal domain-containing protein n=1 Tax=Acidianus sp. TaxID=1872104 RepID=UPI00397B61AC